jgi:uncharacterized protein YecE (DUF72 family)
VLFQLPPNLKADEKLLEEFLAVLPRGVASAFEFRHASWFTDEIFALLKSCNRALCVAETEERVTPDVVTADFCYYRYRKTSYMPEERQAMVNRIQEHRRQGRDVFAYFKHEETPQGVLYAADIFKTVGTLSPS